MSESETVAVTAKFGAYVFKTSKMLAYQMSHTQYFCHISPRMVRDACSSELMFASGCL